MTVSGPGSVTAPSVRVYVEPSFTLAAPLIAIDGGTFATLTGCEAVLDSAFAASLTRTSTVGFAIPSGNEHWNVPVFAALLIDSELATRLPPVPHFG